jgi:DNA-binding Lrp family transcriptional regulator
MLGLNVRGYVMLRLDPRPEIRKKFEKKIEKLKQVVRLHYLLGPEDAILEVLAQNNEEISALVKKLHTFPGVRETETFLIHITVKEENILNLLEAK